MIPDGVEENLANLLQGNCCFYLNENLFEIIIICHNQWLAFVVLCSDVARVAFLGERYGQGREWQKGCG